MNNGICPLREIAFAAITSSPSRCTGSACALWNDEQSECSIKSLRHLADVKEKLDYINDTVNTIGGKIK